MKNLFILLLCMVGINLCVGCSKDATVMDEVEDLAAKAEAGNAQAVAWVP